MSFLSMRLLLKWLRPVTVPSSRRKNIPFRTRLQFSLYRECLKVLQKWYQKYAFSDTVVISGHPAIRVSHEHRDIDFESELKRLRLPIQDDMIERQGASSSQLTKTKRRRYYNCLRFKDHFVLDIAGQKVAIDHADGRTIVSTIKGVLKESDANSIVSKFFFAGSLKDGKMTNIGRQANVTSSSPHQKTEPRPQRIPGVQKSGGIFGDDPLLGKDTRPIKAPDTPIKGPEPIIKSVAGVEIDESF